MELEELVNELGKFSKELPGILKDECQLDRLGWEQRGGCSKKQHHDVLCTSQFCPSFFRRNLKKD